MARGVQRLALPAPLKWRVACKVLKIMYLYDSVVAVSLIDYIDSVDILLIDYISVVAVSLIDYIDSVDVLLIDYIFV